MPSDLQHLVEQARQEASGKPAMEETLNNTELMLGQDNYSAADFLPN